MIPDDLSNYKVARAGDLVINKMKAWQGSLGLAPTDGIVSPAYFVFEADFDVPDFGEYLLRSKPFVAKFGAASDGVRIGQWDLDISRMRNIEVFLPSPAEQGAIVKYLAHANGRIDKAIEAKRRLVELLRQHHRALVWEKLTDGGRQDPRDIVRVGRGKYVDATGWTLTRAGNLCEISTGIEDSGNATEDGEYPFYVRGREVLRAKDYLFDTEAVLTPGDGQGGVGKVFHYCNGRFQAHQRVYVFHRFEGISARYFYWYLSTFFRAHALSQSSTVTMESLRLPVLASFPVIFPSADQQVRLVEEIESELSLMERQVEVANKEIHLLEEFRSRLVADVVTGKLDVRDVAASLQNSSELAIDLVEYSSEMQTKAVEGADV